MSAKLISWHTSAIIRRRESFQLQLDLSESACVYVAHELILQLWNGQAAYCLYCEGLQTAQPAQCWLSV